MQADVGNHLQGHNSAQKYISEAVVTERKLWKLIQSASPLDTEVKELYHKARSSYENSLLCHCEFAQLHDNELALWRLHYNIIDDFRKRMQANSVSKDCLDLDVTHDEAVRKDKSNSLLERFKTFLTEATEFYEKMSEKIKKCHGIAVEKSASKEDSSSNISELTAVQRCQYLCHRCSVCLGDLARYNELYGKCNDKNQNWSIAAYHYLNASVLWPGSGNARNQLAVLAMYIGDELLAVYHCIRSLAIKEPFLNAWDNLLWLFEKNRSSQLHSYCKEMATSTFDFLEPCKRNVKQSKERTGVNQSCCSTVRTNDDASSSEETSLWNLAVRMISLFFTKSSCEEFSSIFSSFISEMEAWLSADDSKLVAALESYKYIGCSADMAGHFRVLQLVSAFIFSIHTLSDKQKFLDQPISVVLALTATLICMGRLIERCTRTNVVHTSPLLPAILVFLEWFFEWPDLSEIDESDQRYTFAFKYYSRTFVDLLNKINENREISSGPTNSSYCHTALWEDYELRGFSPLASVHKSLHFTQGNDNNDGNICPPKDGEPQNLARVHRILVAAQKVVENGIGSSRTQKWIYYDKAERKFFLGQSNKGDLLDASLSGSMKGNEQQVGEASFPNSKYQPLCGDSIPVKEEKEEEEEIVFKPTARHQGVGPGLFIQGHLNKIAASSACGSSPLTRFCSNNYMAYPTALYKDKNAFDSSTNPMLSSDFGIPFSFVGQTTADTSRFGIAGHGTTGLPSQLDRAPSLSAWGSLGSDIEEMPRNLGNWLTIDGATDRRGDGNLPPPRGDSICPVCTSTTIVGPPYSAPLPSAPPMPSGDGISSPWNGNDIIRQFSATTTMLQDLMMDRQVMPNIGCATSAQLSNYLHSKWNRTTQGTPTLDSSLSWHNGYAPQFFPGRVAGDSSQWLPRQWNNPYQDYSNDPSWPVGRFYSPSQLGRFQDVDVSNLAPYNGWALNYIDGAPYGSPSPPPSSWQYLAYSTDKEMMERYHLGGYQGMGWRHGGVVDEMLERQRLLQYLKEKEWALQQQGHTQIKGPS